MKNKNYSLKKVYKNILSENTGVQFQADIPAQSINLNTSSGNLYKDATQQRYRSQSGYGDTDETSSSLGLLYGKFSDAANSLWGFKDGLGGRGEYTLVYDILANSQIGAGAATAKPRKVSDFLKDVKDNPLYKINFNKMLSDQNYKFINPDTGSQESFYCSNQQVFEDKLSNLLKFNVKCYFPQSRSNWNEFVDYFTSADDDNHLSNAIIEFENEGNKPTELKSIKPKINSLKDYISSLAYVSANSSLINSSNLSQQFEYHLIKSVTTSGEESKSCDISINTSILTDEQKNYFKCGNRPTLRIEVKEVSSWKHARDGIRLGGGSRLAVLRGDLFFALSVIAIGTNVNESSEGDEDLKRILIKFKRGEIGKGDFNALLSYIKSADDLIAFLEDLIEKSNVSNERNRISSSALDMLKRKLNYSQVPYKQTSKMPVNDRANLIDIELKDIIFNSLSADWFAICLGKKSKEYKNQSQSDQRGMLEYVMIHKDEYRNFLSTAKISNSGVAYAGFKHDSPGWLEGGWKGSLQAGVNEAFLKSHHSIHISRKRQAFINKFRKKCLKNSILKEVYSNLFKKKLISEGGKAGHMMHPYENLHMKISEMKQMIRDFQNDFEISEKVDGANLFFTVNPESGEVLFSRNRADMSHQETLEKFGPDHPAHILFTEGANSIFNSVKASLNTEDIKRIFGNSPEGGKTYINFEIMHPQKPNQIKYDKKYIVFHSIVDFDINGNKVSSSPDDQRLLVLLEKLENYFENNSDFSLGSNLKIKLNTLTEQEVEELIQELDRISSSLGLSDDMTIADAVKKEINILLDKEGLNELLSEDRIEMIYDFITNENTTIKGSQIKKGLDKEIQKSLTSLGVTSKAKTYSIIKAVIEDFKPLFILLGIKLLHTIPSRYMSEEAGNKNVDELRRLLNAAIQDFESIKSLSNITNEQQKIIDALEPNIENVLRYGIERVVSSPVEGGVFIGYDGNTYKVTGGFAPLNQILGTSMRNLDIMPIFKEEFISQER